MPFLCFIGNDAAVIDVARAITITAEQSGLVRQVEIDLAVPKAAHSAVRCKLWLGGIPLLATMSSHLVMQLDHAALIGFDLRVMEGDVSVELLEEWDPITDQDPRIE